ncbi:MULTISPECIES: hypothetical protein [Geobacillus]|uniref:Uncharacterized protein n=1 Tax=Geobacillus thermocatenulatus TaxID=33938 RepID=A0A226QA33_9BACL|nr:MULTISPECIES: hypothetical protein [Geobacillus]KPC99642.1 hypothetical protein LR69_02043 [Geobacillus sp. BCO2]RAN22455.1 hypothetical protein VC88_11010 [Geobacillus sp. A8]ASS98547.1 hypothetical protein GT3921_05560 [Geobacillus thermocatenulatus]KLR74061.1 hypothetical protein ABH20_07700 [Geobacillus sp. T6]OXB89301.1 hypothetical protein B9L19_04295 [Geobacillus thermocatenulatus]
MHDEQEQLTMSKRIEAFYRQSGGPGSPTIRRLLERHLLYGKDHGLPGKKEEFEDVIRDVFLQDHSTRPLVMGFFKLKTALRKEWDAYLKALGARPASAEEPDIARKRV